MLTSSNVTARNNKNLIYSGPYGILRRIEHLTKSEKYLLVILVIFFLVSTLWLFADVNHRFMANVPVSGGKLSEGIIGVPRFINPVLSVSGPDKDLTELVFSGLLKPSSDGSYAGDLAKSFTFSQDNKSITVVLNSGLTWHDGISLTADDVVFTINRIKDPLTRSPQKASWDGVTVEKIDDLTIQFNLAAAYTPFVENLTIGIIPMHIWQQVGPSEMIYSTTNLRAIGSGPYTISEVKQNKSGIPEYISLKAWTKYHLDKPFISKISIGFFSNEETLVSAYLSGKVDSISGITANTAKYLKEKGTTVIDVPLSRVFGIFFNQKDSAILARKEVRSALELAINKKALVDSTLLGFGTALSGPLPPQFQKSLGESSLNTNPADVLSSAGWKLNEDGIYQLKTKTETLKLAFSLSTSNSDELKKVAEQIKTDWERIGVAVDIKVFDTADLNQDIIRNRKYDALLFGEVIGHYPDPFAFWHTSQRLDPGLNISMYSSSKVDSIAIQLRGTTNLTERNNLYDKFADEIINDKPAIFLYSPHYIYVPQKGVENMQFSNFSEASDRFLFINKWFVYSESIWKFLN